MPPARLSLWAVVGCSAVGGGIAGAAARAPGRRRVRPGSPFRPAIRSAHGRQQPCTPGTQRLTDLGSMDLLVRPSTRRTQPRSAPRRPVVPHNRLRHQGSRSGRTETDPSGYRNAVATQSPTSSPPLTAASPTRHRRASNRRSASLDQAHAPRAETTPTAHPPRGTAVCTD
jgi:hypothetical protein